MESGMKTKIYQFATSIFLLAFLVGCGGPTITISLPNTSPSEPPVAKVENKPTTTQTPINVRLPKGVFVDTQDNYGLTYVNLQGQPITELKTPGIGYADPHNSIIAGSVTSGPIQVPLVYKVYDPQQAIMVNVNDQIETLLKAQNIFNLAGAPGLPILAYSQIDQQEKGIASKLFVGKLETIAKSTAVISQFDDQNFLAINPLVVEANNDTIEGVWYTKTPFGIGGDIVFDIYGGLYFYNFASGEIKEYMDVKQQFQGLAPDLSLAASEDTSVAGEYSLKVLDLIHNTVTPISLDASSDRGAGFVEFSPDNHFMAWMEGSGFQMSETPNFHCRVRVAQLDESIGVVRDLTDTSVADTLGIPIVARIKPVGWLDNHTVLIEVRQDDWNKVSLAKLDVVSGTLTIFFKGSFIGFVYE
jgi:hypothetical protein